MRAIFGMILERSIAETGSTDRGFEWLKRLDAQTKEYVINASVLVEKIARREGLVTVWDLPDVLLEMRRSKDLAYVFPSSGTPVIDDAVGLVRRRETSRGRRRRSSNGSAVPRRSSLAARNAYRLPARTDLPDGELPAWARDVERKMTPAKMDWDLLEREGQAGWRSGTGK